jgi:hypothetical protein
LAKNTSYEAPHYAVFSKVLLTQIVISEEHFFANISTAFVELAATTSLTKAAAILRYGYFYVNCHENVQFLLV